MSILRLFLYESIGGGSLGGVQRGMSQGEVSRLAFMRARRASSGKPVMRQYSGWIWIFSSSVPAWRRTLAHEAKPMSLPDFTKATMGA